MEILNSIGIAILILAVGAAITLSVWFYRGGWRKAYHEMSKDLVEQSKLLSEMREELNKVKAEKHDLYLILDERDKILFNSLDHIVHLRWVLAENELEAPAIPTELIELIEKRKQGD